MSRATAPAPPGSVRFNHAANSSLSASTSAYVSRAGLARSSARAMATACGASATARRHSTSTFHFFAPARLTRRPWSLTRASSSSRSKMRRSSSVASAQHRSRTARQTRTGSG